MGSVKVDKPLRRDAQRNREKLIDAATRLFAERGLDAPLEEIARRAEVSVGTLYNHFPTREALFDAILPARVGALEAMSTRAMEHEDAWEGFATFLEELIGMLQLDHGVRDALSRRYPDAAELEAACGNGFARIAEIIERAHREGGLRPDFTVQDFPTLLWATARIVEATEEAAPEAWRRYLRFTLDGLRAENARPIDFPAMTEEQVGRAMHTLAGTGRAPRTAPPARSR